MRDFCPACRSENIAYAFTKSGYDLFKCAECDFLFVHPFPSAEVIAQHYRDHYRGATSTFYPKAESRRWRAFWRSLKFLPYVYGKRVVDVGCGGGFMVEAFSRLGAEVCGVDISANSIAYAQNRYPKLKFFCEGLDDFRRRGMEFDFVFSSEVLEHLPGPDEFMELMAGIVAPKGYVYLSAPDAGHPKVPTNIQEWSDICPPEHLQFFNERNLAILFQRYGFTQHRREHHRTPAHSVFFRRNDSPPQQ